ncbi:MAG: TonB-dependent receptor [Akkermansiaceae bacterium]
MTTNTDTRTQRVASSRELLALATFAAMTSASAQDALKPIEALADSVVAGEEVAVINPPNLSSSKMTAPLLDTPQTFNVVTKEVFEQQGARNLTDVLKNTPGISFSAGENGFSSNPNNFNLRGTDASGSVFIDGVRDSGSYTRDIFNVERVEIAKGAADENGRGGAGGYVNIVSKTPHLDDFLTLNSSLGHSFQSGDPLFRQSIDLNRQLTLGSLEATAFRMNAFYQEGGILGRGDAENNAWGFAPSIGFGIGTNSSLTLSYQHTESNDIPDYGVPAAFVKGTKNYVSGTSGFIDNFYGTDQDFDDTSYDSITATYRRELTNGGVLTNQMRFSQSERNAGFISADAYDPVTGLVSGRALRYNRENTLYSNQLNYTNDFDMNGINHKISAGVDFSHEESDALRFGTGSVADTSASDPLSSRAVTFGASSASANVEVTSFAAYLYDTAKLSENWQLTGGLRAEHYDFQLTDSDGSFNYGKNDTYVGGKLGLVYKPQENVSYYGAVGLSYLPPGSFLSSPDISREGGNAFPGAGGGVNNPDAEAQQNFNYEVGGKWDLYDGRLSTTAGLFYTNRKNIVISDGRGNTIGEGEQNLYGLELGITGKITDRWDVFGGLLVMNSERDHFTDVRNTSGRPEDDPYGDVNGDELAFTPNVSMNLFTTYEATDKLTVGGGMQYNGESYVGRTDDHDRIIPNGANGKLPSYIVFNALASYELKDNVTLRLNVDNVFDNAYAISTNWGSTRAQVAPPRTFTISAEWKF